MHDEHAVVFILSYTRLKLFQARVTGLSVKRMVTAYHLTLNAIPYRIVATETSPMRHVRYYACKSYSLVVKLCMQLP